MIRSLPRSLVQQAGRELDSLRSQLSNGVGCRSSSRLIRRIGAERECVLLTADGVMAPVANDCVAALGQPWVHMEFPRFVIEANSDPIPAGPRMFHVLTEQLLERRALVSEQARERNARVLDIGLLGSFSQEQMHSGRQIVSSASRYTNLLRNLGTRNGRYSFTLSGLEGDIQVDVPSSPVPGGLTCGFSPNVEFAPSHIGLAADLTVATAFTSCVLASTSPLVLGRVGEWDSRVSFWQYGMDPQRCLSPFSVGRYWKVRGADVLLAWYAEVLGRGELVLSFQEAGLSSDAPGYPALSLLASTFWVQTGRFRPGFTSTGLRPFFENRLCDTNLTVVDDVANEAFYVGLIAHLLKTVDQADELMPHAEAERAYEEARRNGSVWLRWRGRDREARTLILDELLPLAQEGLESEGIDSRFAETLLQVVARRLCMGKEGRTGAHWLLARYQKHRDSPCASDTAVRRTLAEVAQIQQTQPRDLSVLEGVADW